MPTGIVVRSTGKFCDVRTASTDEVVSCVIKGKFRLKGIRTTNPVAVGDKVDFDLQEDGSGVLTTIHERKNYIIRKSVNLSKEAHIIASNIDRCFLVVTLAQPPTSTGFIDRFLVSAEAYKIPVTIVFNKIDIYGQEEKERMNFLISVYEEIGYSTIQTSAINSEGVGKIKSAMTGKVSVFSGHSGVGKSSLMNALDSNLDLKTGDVSGYHNKGQHTTTFAEMHHLEFGADIIDTPGIKGFGLIDLSKENLHHHFPEFFKRLPECKFNNCLHLKEPGCAVKSAIENGEIAEFRYSNYLSMIDEFNQDQQYRIDIYQ